MTDAHAPAPTDALGGRPGWRARPATLRDLSLVAIDDATERLRGRIQRTPVLHSTTAARLVASRQGIRLAADRLHVKAEHLQVTGSFKVRGALNRVLAMTHDDLARGLITMSAGNHGQAVAYAAARLGVAATVLMPETASPAKVAATSAYGAQVVLHGTHLGETSERMERIRAESGSAYVPPYDDPLVIAGQGTLAREILADLPEVDVVVVGSGGGGLAAGVAAALRRLRPMVRVYGVEPEGADALRRGVDAGSPVPIAPSSIADGLCAASAGPWTIDLARRHLEDILVVAESTIALGVRFAYERMKQVVEPAGAAALGAVLDGRVPLRDRETVCVVASGGNLDPGRFDAIMALAPTLGAS
jgi:threonine dehydratase